MLTVQHSIRRLPATFLLRASNSMFMRFSTGSGSENDGDDLIKKGLRQIQQKLDEMAAASKSIHKDLADAERVSDSLKKDIEKAEASMQSAQEKGRLLETDIATAESCQEQLASDLSATKLQTEVLGKSIRLAEMERKELSFGIQDAKTEIAATQQQLSQAQAISTTVKADTKKIQDSLSAAQKTQDAVNANLTQIQTDTKNLEDKLKKIKYTMIALGGITVVIGMFWSFPNLIDNFPVLADMVYSFSAQGRAQLGFNLWCHDVLEALPEEKARVQALFLSSNTNSSFLNRLGVSSGYAYGQQLELLTKLGTELNEGRSTTRTVATLLDYYQRSRESNPKFIELLDHQPR